MRATINGFTLDLSLWASHGAGWTCIAAEGDGNLLAAAADGIRAKLRLTPSPTGADLVLRLESERPVRLRLQAQLLDEEDLFHLIPGNIFGDNNASKVIPGQFPCLTDLRPDDPSCALLWEFRADRASHPVSMLCCRRGAVGLSIDPYSDAADGPDGFICNGVFAALPDAFGVALGYGNDPLTFIEKRHFGPSTAHYTRAATARGRLFAVTGDGRRAVHGICRSLYADLRQRPIHQRSYDQGLRALAEAFAEVNWSDELQQYTNRKCRVPADTQLRPWRAIVEIGWTGGSMMAYPFMLAEARYPDLRMPRTGAALFDQICAGFNDASGFIRDACLNRSTRNRPAGWNESDIDGWWSGYLPNTRSAHCAYTNAHAAYYMLQAGIACPAAARPRWRDTAFRVLDTAVALQRDDGAFGYLFADKETRVLDFEGFAGCWFVPALVLAWRSGGDDRYRRAACRAMEYYAPFVRALTAWGSPMDTYRSIDSEGNLAFIRGARLLHESTGEPRYLDMLTDGAHYEYLWRYAFRARPQCPPLKGSGWNSCGGSLTSVSNPHIHPMSVVATADLEYLARLTGDAYHQDRADDGLAWLMNTMELYPEITGYGRFGVLSERTCPSDGLLVETYADGSPASTWWSYNAWAAASAMEALAEKLLAGAS